MQHGILYQSRLLYLVDNTDTVIFFSGVNVLGANTEKDATKQERLHNYYFVWNWKSHLKYLNLFLYEYENNSAYQQLVLRISDNSYAYVHMSVNLVYI